jgi:organic radical activating enzyme
MDSKSLDPQLDFDATIKWLDRFRPDTEIHLMGGEPLLLDTIEADTKKLIDAGYRVTMYTNGEHVRRRPKLLDLPLRWIVAYHQGDDAGNTRPIGQYLEQIEQLRGCPNVLVQTVLHEEWHEGNVDKLVAAFDGFLFIPRWANDHRRSWETAGLINVEIPEHPASHIMLIEPWGDVFPCNYRGRGRCGNVYDMTLDQILCDDWDTHVMSCFENHSCGAFYSSVLMNGICICP